MKKIIAIDLMGGDHSIEESYPGVVLFANANPDYKIIGFALKGWDIPSDIPSNIEIRFSESYIKNDDGVLSVVRQKDSSLRMALEAVKNDEASAIVAATASGPFVGGAFNIFKTFNENIKPVFAPIYLNNKSEERLLLDAGASLDASSLDLLNYAKLGKALWNILHPEVTDVKSALMNIGVESKKGDQFRVETYGLLEENKEQIGFVGNIEPSDMLTAVPHLLITDAWTGNIALKTLEGSIKTIGGAIRSIKTNGGLLSKIGLLLLKKDLGKALNSVMQKNAGGGALILGLNNIAVKAHGFSKRNDYLKALEVAKKSINGDLIVNTKKELEK